MVIVKLVGGLGNQMFQYATGRAVAYRNGANLLLDASGYKQGDLRRYELDAWSIEGLLASPEDLAQVSAVDCLPRWWQRVKNIFSNYPPLTLYKESSFAYEQEITDKKTPIYLEGYWQSERYFSEIAQTLRREFIPKQLLDEKNQAMIKLIHSFGPRAVSVHIRRGDYVSDPDTAHYHGCCSVEYYRASVAYIASQVVDPQFFIFSDDLDWVRQNLSLECEMTLVDVNDTERGVSDMVLMNACRHHIIANSSFSWWGAWLNPNPDKLVVAPRRWFASAKHNTHDLIPASWVKL